MIDMFALLVSSGMLAIIVFFAIRLNHERPWFEGGKPSAPGSRSAAAPRPGAAKGAATGAGRRPGTRAPPPWRARR